MNGGDTDWAALIGAVGGVYGTYANSQASQAASQSAAAVAQAQAAAAASAAQAAALQAQAVADIERARAQTAAQFQNTGVAGPQPAPRSSGGISGWWAARSQTEKIVIGLTGTAVVGGIIYYATKPKRKRKSRR